MPEPLSELFDRYSRGTLERKEFEGLIFRNILNDFKQFHLFRWTREDWVDYLCWLYPRISRAIDNYRNQGSSFDSYIRSLVRWSAREYRSREADHLATEYACWSARARDLFACSQEPDYAEPPPALKPVSNPRQVLVLLLKSYYFVSEDFIARAAPAIGIKKEKLGQLIEELRKQRMEREEEIRTLRERIYTQYYRCLTLEKRIDAAPEGSAHREKMKQCRERAVKRLAGMRRRLGSIRLDPSNRQVAEVLGVPKGTIDSNLYAVKAKRRTEDRPLS